MTSPDIMANLHWKKKDTNSVPPLICNGDVQKNLTKTNSFYCNERDQAVHLMCVRVSAGGCKILEPRNVFLGVIKDNPTTNR